MNISLKTKSIWLVGAAALALAACGKPETTGAEQESGPHSEADRAANAGDVPDFQAIADAAVADAGRPAADREDDARRKPATALAFMEVAPGMTVIDIEGGAGWYTEMLSHAVGENGKVIMQNPQGFRSFVGDEIDARLAGGRLANVRESYSLFDALDAGDESVDLAIWIQGPHELYYKPEGGSLGDPAGSYAEVYRILKPGGAFVVIDHSAESGAPETTGNDLHRIDKTIVMQMADQAGFTLTGESTFLANPADSLTTSVFDESIRGHTDQFALRFRKPE